MGYHYQGILLLANPRVELLSALPPGITLRLWRHRGLPRVWVLEAWDAREPSPLPLGAVFDGIPALSHPVARRLAELAAALGQAESPYGGGWLAFSCRVAQLLGQPVFAFLSDQSRFDFAFKATGGRVEQLALRLRDLDLRYEQDRFKVIPGPSASVALEPGGDVDVLEADSTRGTPRMHRHITELWPHEAGDPAELLGLGYWDGASRFLDRFDLVAERASRPQKEDYRHVLVRVPEEIRSSLEAATDRLFFNDPPGAARALIEAARVCRQAGLSGHATALWRRAVQLDPQAPPPEGPEEPLPPWAATFYSLLFHPIPATSATSYDLTSKEFVPAAQLLADAQGEAES